MNEIRLIDAIKASKLEPIIYINKRTHRKCIFEGTCRLYGKKTRMYVINDCSDRVIYTKKELDKLFVKYEEHI